MKEERAKRLEQEIKRDRGGWTLRKRHIQLTDSPFTSPGQTLSQECADIPKAKPSSAAGFKDFWHSHQMPGKHNLGAPLVPAGKLTSFLEDRPSSSLPSPEASSEPGGMRPHSQSLSWKGHACCSTGSPGKAHSSETISVTW